MTGGRKYVRIGNRPENQTIKMAYENKRTLRIFITIIVVLIILAGYPRMKALSKASWLRNVANSSETYLSFLWSSIEEFLSGYCSNDQNSTCTKNLDVCNTTANKSISINSSLFIMQN